MNEVLRRATRNKYAVASFNCWNMTSIRAIIAAAEEKRSPIILALYEHIWDYIPIDYFTILGRREAENASVPVVLHLDHGSSLESVLQCVQRGVNSVMIDGSELDLNENIALSKEIVNIVHRLTIPVEGELGRTSAVGPRMTDPSEAKAYVEETGVDSLSVSIGNVSGMKEGTARIDFDRLKKIRKDVTIPLVLHGGTGVPLKSLKKCIRMGIAKINVGHQLFRASIKATQQIFCSPEVSKAASKSLHAHTLKELESVKKVAMQKIEEFDSAKRA